MNKAFACHGFFWKVVKLNVLPSHPNQLCRCRSPSDWKRIESIFMCKSNPIALEKLLQTKLGLGKGAHLKMWNLYLGYAWVQSQLKGNLQKPFKITISSVQRFCSVCSQWIVTDPLTANLAKTKAAIIIPYGTVLQSFYGSVTIAWLLCYKLKCACQFQPFFSWRFSF